MSQCANCHAELPAARGGRDPFGRWICCAFCLVHPLGCRCQYGEYGIAETSVDPEAELSCFYCGESPCDCDWEP